MFLNLAYLSSKLKSNKLAQIAYNVFLYRKARTVLEQTSKWGEQQKVDLVEMLTYSRTHCPYYSNIIPSTKIDSNNVLDILKCLPLLDKRIIRKEGKNIYSDEISDDWKIWLNTGGSTGEPLKFPALYHKISPLILNLVMLYIRMGYKIGDTIVAIDGNRVPDSEVSKHVYWKTSGNFPWGKIHFSTLYLSEKTILYYWEVLNKEKPKIIYGYPSGLLEMVRLFKLKSLSLPFKVKGIYLTSENFSQDDKEYISGYFSCPVFGQYGHTESSIFAYQKYESTEYYCSPGVGYTEILDNNGNHVKEGEIGEVVVTGFVEYGLPFIRYKTGDLARYGGITGNGETIISELMGRDVDYILDKSGGKIYLVGFIFGGHIKAFNVISSWQIQQSKRGEVKLLVVKTPQYTKETETEIIKLFDSKGISATIEYIESIPKTIRGKQKFLIRDIID